MMTTPGGEKLLRQLLEQMDPALQQISATELASIFADSRDLSAGRSALAPRRWEDQIIESLIPPGATVLDVGCGDGELLAKLLAKQVRGQGIELDQSAVFKCVARGVPVLQIDVDQGLREFADGSFDYVVLEETLQTVRRPVELLQEMVRVGARGIVSFPNFGFWKVRVDLLLRGRMPVTQELPWRWYDTPNIHLLCLQDFLDWVQQHKVKVVQAHVFAAGEVRPMQEGDTLYAEQCLLMVER